jgi:hypothetical protein
MLRRPAMTGPGVAASRMSGGERSQVAGESELIVALF